MNQTVLVFDKSVPMIAFAAGELTKVLAQKNEEVSDAPLNRINEITAPNRFVLTTLDSGLAKNLLKKSSIEAISNLVSEGYAIRKDVGNGYTAWWIIGSDPSGAMYGALDVADALKSGQNLQHIKNEIKSPYIDKRGIKFNIPLDARTPSYSDNGDAALNNIEVMWDMDFWTEYLDEMALNRFNTLSLWNMHPFPSMVKVPEYPNIALDDVMKTTATIKASLRGMEMSTPSSLKQLVTIKKITIEEKIEFWQQVMQYAKDRGIDVFIITWNIFTYGTEGNQYGINDDQDNETTIDYFRASVRSLLETYPLLKGIGVTAGENMQGLDSPYSNEDWLWRTYGEGVLDVKKNNPDRVIPFIHRGHETSLAEIEEAFSKYPDSFEFSYKYSLAHMYSSAKPPFIYNDGFIDQLPNGKKTWLTVRDDDFYYFRYGNPGFARQYLLNMPPSHQLAGFYMGPDGIIWGREFTSTEPDSPRQSIIKKHWYSFSLWGKLAYNPMLSDHHFESMLAYRFPEVNGRALYEAWATASEILPLVTTFHWEGNSLDFQWYPEACYSHPQRAKGYHTVEHFIQDRPMIENGMIGILEYCEKQLAHQQVKGKTPLQVANDLNHYADRTLAIVKDINEVQDKDLRLTLGDLKSMAYLGQYYAAKILGAVELCLYRKGNDPKNKSRAVEHLKEASVLWKEYADQTASQYIPQFLTRQGYDIVDVQGLQTLVDQDIAIAEESITKQGKQGVMNG
jgi:hypothetical protein